MSDDPLSVGSARWLDAGDPRAHAASLTTRFAHVFGRPAHGVWFAPGRANLNGEHIDFHGGRCLPMALRHGTYAAAAPRTDGLLRLRTLDSQLDSGVLEIRTDTEARNTGAADDAAPSGQRTEEDWTQYVWGVLWAMRQLEEEHPELAVGPEFGADVLIRSTLPIGAGLSSSASLECAAALAFAALGSPLGQQNSATNSSRPNFNAALSDEHRAVLAQACIRAEVEVVGAGTGGLDQTTSLRAAEGQLLSLDCRDFSLEYTDAASLLADYRFVAVDTGHPHALATSQFTDRRAESEAAAAVLGVQRLREALGENPTAADVEQALRKYDAAAAPNALGGADPDACRRRLEHALTEMLRSETIHRLLTGHGHGVGHAAQLIGETMTAGHASMRDKAEVSFDLADQVVETAAANGGLGARLIGGGFGGSVLMLLHQADLHSVVSAVDQLSPDIRFLAVEPSPGAHAV